MKNVYFIFAATACASVCGPMYAQTAQTGIVYQQAGAMTVGTASAGKFFSMALPGLVGPELFNPETVAGSPFSATHKSHSLQVLSDGTRIERSESQQVYRDSMGRTRIESGPDGLKTVVIQDPVAGTMTMLESATKTAHEMPAPRMAKFSLSGNGPVSGVPGRIQGQIGTGGGFVTYGGPGEPGTGVMIAQAGVPGGATGPLLKPVIEDLPVQNVNGVPAAGRRTTLTIAAGEIGNDRPIQVVGETWYSTDLQMVVKSSNSDPRFGDTAYELINIGRNEPDPVLFQIPADYTLSEGKPAQIMKLKTVQP